MSALFENKSVLWVVHISNDEAIAKRAQAEAFICIGWTRIGDLSDFDTRDKMKAAYRKAFPKASDASLRASYGQVYRFAHEMQVGDPVVYPIKGSRDILLGEIAGPYSWVVDDSQLVNNDYCNVRKVVWHKRVPRITFTQDALHSFGGFSSVATANDYLEEVTAAIKSEKPSPAIAAPLINPTISETEGVEPKVDLADQVVEETKDYLLRQWSRTKQQFEPVVAALLRAMGYATEVQQGTHDLGVDVIAHTDPLGVHPPLLKVQAKSGTGRTGAKEVKELRGLLNQGEKGVIVALGGFTNDARHVQQNDADLVLIDGDRFVELFLEFYDRLDAEIRHQFPLRRVHVYTG